jgi:hypothetical protein
LIFGLFVISMGTAGLERAIQVLNRKETSFGNELLVANPKLAKANAEQSDFLSKRLREATVLIGLTESKLELSQVELEASDFTLQRWAIAAETKENQLTQMKLKLARVLTDKRQDRANARDQQREAVVKYRQLLVEVAKLRFRKRTLRTEVRLGVIAPGTATYGWFEVCKLVFSQLKRIERVKTKMVDTNLWQVGIKQRVKTKELRQFLKTEIYKVSNTITKHREEIANHQELADKYDVEAASADADIVVIQAGLRSVVECVKAGKSMVRRCVAAFCVNGSDRLNGMGRRPCLWILTRLTQLSCCRAQHDVMCV